MPQNFQQQKKINPQHTIPTIVDNGFAIWESRAIMIYLQEKYGKTDHLYPNDLQKRALINQRLMFDQERLYTPIFKHLMLVYKRKPANPDYLAYIRNAFEFLNIFLTQSEYVAGDHLTLADISTFASVSTVSAIGFNFSEFQNVVRWYDLLKTTIPGYELNNAGLEIIQERISSRAEFRRIKKK